MREALVRITPYIAVCGSLLGSIVVRQGGLQARPALTEDVLDVERTICAIDDDEAVSDSRQGCLQVRPALTEAILGVETTIYVIDDDEAVCDSLRVLLELRGFEVAAYASAEAFLDDHARQAKPERGCILLDLDLPGMSGLDLLRTLRSNGSRLPVVVITGRGASALAEAEAAGALEFLEKPFLDGALMSCIERALRAA